MKLLDEQALILDAEKRTAIAILDDLPVRIDIPLVSDCAAEHRYLRAGVTENYGRWKKESVPHLVEIMDRLHPDDPCTHVSVMKSVQSAVTVSVAENAMILWLKYQLGSVFYFTSNQKIGKIRSSSAIDTMIDDSGMAHLVKPMSQRVSQKKADSATYKEFEGGIKLQIGSYGSIGDMKSNSYQLIIPDEWDEAPPELADQGDIAGIIEGRTMAARIYKILEISTPSRMETSRIYKSYMMGDQRQYFMPCPLCQAPQILELKYRNIDYGLTFNRIKDPTTGVKILDSGSVRYICKHCGGEFFEASKMQMLTDGEWRPTATPVNPRRHSYHSPGLISPFLSWERICQRFIDTQFGEDLLLFKDFWINFLGKSWARVESAKSWEKLRDRAEDYSLGEVPNGGIRLYGGCDVQGDRLELAVVAVGEGLEKWLVDYQVFFGNPADIDDVCWSALHTFGYSQKYRILKSDVHINRIGVDCGYRPNAGREKDWGAKASTVYNFVGLRQDKFVAVRGIPEDRTSDIVKESRVSGGILTKSYLVNVSIIKEMIVRVIEEPSGPGAIHFPKWRQEGDIRRPIGDHIFQGFLSERFQEIKPGVMGWKKIYTRNEPLDTFIYAMACMYLDNLQTYDERYWQSYREQLASA